jgi:transcriptional regulator with XRE-family HTH domain
VGRCRLVLYHGRKERKNIGTEEDMNLIHMYMGRKIRQLRKRLGMTQEELAYRAQMDLSYLGQIERGARPSPSISVVARIARALSVDSGELLEPHAKDSAMDGSKDIAEAIAQELKTVSLRELKAFYQIIKLVKDLQK